MPDGPIPPAPDTGGEAGGWGGGRCRGAEEAAEKPDKPRAKKVKRMQRARFHKNRFCASSLTQAHFSSFDFPRRPLSSLFFHPGTQLPLLPSPTRGSAPPCRAGQLRGAPAAGRVGGAQGHLAFPDARASRPHPGGPALFLLRVPLYQQIFSVPFGWPEFVFVCRPLRVRALGRESGRRLGRAKLPEAPLRADARASATRGRGARAPEPACAGGTPTPLPGDAASLRPLCAPDPGRQHRPRRREGRSGPRRRPPR